MSERSLCCRAPVQVSGRTTLYYVCEKCGKACDCSPVAYNCMTEADDSKLSRPEGQRAPCPESADNGDALGAPPSGRDHHCPTTVRYRALAGCHATRNASGDGGGSLLIRCESPWRASLPWKHPGGGRARVGNPFSPSNAKAHGMDADRND